jgi:hypothetical protein
VKGTNTLTLNGATMVEALQLWLNSKLDVPDSVEVTNVVRCDNYCFEVTIVEKETK